MKKKSILLALGLLLQTCSAPLIAYDFDEDDDFAIDTDLNDLSLEHVNNSNMTRTPADNATAIAAFFALIDDPNAILNNPIYQKTSLIRTRSILELPFALTYGFDLQDNHAISLMLYLNTCSAKNFTSDSTTLDSYFLLASPEKVAEFQKVDDLLSRDTLARFAKSLALFDPARVQENRIGGLLESHIQLPILYAERNLFLTNSEQAAIALSPLGSMLTTDGVDANDFKYQHLVMDQFGIGDFKFKTMYETYRSEKFDLDCGGFIILPTATALKQGIIGTWIDQNNDRAYLDLTSIDPTSITVQNQDDIANFFLAGIDKLSSNILNCPLGNNGHVVLAPSFNFDYYINQNWKLSSDYSLQIPLLAEELRFYQKTQSQADFMAAYSTAFNSDATTFVNFISHELQDLFFPYAFPTMVFPGIVFNSTNQFVYHHNPCDFYFGSNFWYQGAESLTISKSALNSGSAQLFTYDYAGATTTSAAQEKLFGKISYNTQTTNYSWSLSAYGDITVWNSGIGNDFTLGLCVDCKF